MSIGILDKFEKRTDEVKSYLFDYSDFLADKGDTIGTVTSITPTPAGLNVDSFSNLNGIVKAIASGGVAGVVYILKCVITTADQGLVEDASVQVTVRPA